MIKITRPWTLSQITNWEEEITETIINFANETLADIAVEDLIYNFNIYDLDDMRSEFDVPVEIPDEKMCDWIIAHNETYTTLLASVKKNYLIEYC